MGQILTCYGRRRSRIMKMESTILTNSEKLHQQYSDISHQIQQLRQEWNMFQKKHTRDKILQDIKNLQNKLRSIELHFNQVHHSPHDLPVESIESEVLCISRTSSDSRSPSPPKITPNNSSDSWEKL